MSNVDSAIIGGGCFWCVEGIYRQFKGIVDVQPGYAGGDKENPTYAEVCAGSTGHAEVAKIDYDTSVFSYKEILEIFFSAHDPTTQNRQGDDIGTQYRSVVFYMSEEQKRAAFKVIISLTEEKVFWDSIITEVSKHKKFWPAEDYHKNYYDSHSDEPYCNMVISPKIAKIRKKFRHFFVD